MKTSREINSAQVIKQQRNEKKNLSGGPSLLQNHIEGFTKSINALEAHDWPYLILVYMNKENQLVLRYWNGDYPANPEMEKECLQYLRKDIHTLQTTNWQSDKQLLDWIKSLKHYKPLPAIKFETGNSELSKIPNETRDINL